jgi:glycosyltransferase involved in cell wall biosynthesis
MHGLKYISWGDTTGYAVAAKSYVKALMAAGVELTWAPMLTGAGPYEAYGATDWPCAQLGSVCNRSIPYDTVLIHTVPEYYSQWLAQERIPGRRILGYTVWELERLPDHWPAILNQLDGVIVPCRWNVDAFRRSGVTVPIHVVPHLSQFERMPSASAEDVAALHSRLGSTLQSRPFIFYTVGFWSHRKAPYLALEAYWRAFTAADPVLLVIKTCTKDITRWSRSWRHGFRRRHPSPIQTVAAMARQHVSPAPVVVIADESLSDGEMLALHQAGDCFVSLARTEGWGLGAFEAARLGHPVVMTSYGGQRDFLDPAYSWLVDYTLVPVHEPTWGANHRPGDRWAAPSVEQAAAHLQDIHRHRAEAADKAARLAVAIGERFSSDAVVAAMLRALCAGSPS